LVMVDVGRPETTVKQQGPERGYRSGPAVPP